MTTIATWVGAKVYGSKATGEAATAPSDSKTGDCQIERNRLSGAAMLRR